MTDGCLLYCLFLASFSSCFIPLGFSSFSFPALLLLRMHVHVHVYRSSGCFFFPFLSSRPSSRLCLVYTSPPSARGLPNTFSACFNLCFAAFTLAVFFPCTAQTNDDLTLSCCPCLTTLTHSYSRACRRRYTEYPLDITSIPPPPFRPIVHYSLPWAAFLSFFFLFLFSSLSDLAFA